LAGVGSSLRSVELSERFAGDFERISGVDHQQEQSVPGKARLQGTMALAVPDALPLSITARWRY
jgi:hypothetical protein